MRSSGKFLNNMCHWPEWLAFSSWLLLFNRDPIRIWSNWFKFLQYFEEIFCESGKRTLMPFTCFPENESGSARALKVLQSNFIAIWGARSEAGRTRSLVKAQEHRSEQSWPIGKSVSAGTSSKRLMFLAFTAIAAFLKIYTVILFIADVS